jgi:hypothetical protein
MQKPAIKLFHFHEILLAGDQAKGRLSLEKILKVSGMMQALKPIEVEWVDECLFYGKIEWNCHSQYLNSSFCNIVMNLFSENSFELKTTNLILSGFFIGELPQEILIVVPSRYRVQ